MDATVVVGQQGRLVLPVEIREALGVQAGDRLHLHRDGSRLIVETLADPVESLRMIGRNLAPERSLVDELLRDRRREAADE